MGAYDNPQIIQYDYGAFQRSFMEAFNQGMAQNREAAEIRRRKDLADENTEKQAIDRMNGYQEDIWKMSTGVEGFTTDLHTFGKNQIDSFYENIKKRRKGLISEEQFRQTESNLRENIYYSKTASENTAKAIAQYVEDKKAGKISKKMANTESVKLLESLISGQAGYKLNEDGTSTGGIPYVDGSTEDEPKVNVKQYTMKQLATNPEVFRYETIADHSSIEKNAAKLVSNNKFDLVERKHRDGMIYEVYDPKLTKTFLHNDPDLTMYVSDNLESLVEDYMVPQLKEAVEAGLIDKPKNGFPAFVPKVEDPKTPEEFEQNRQHDYIKDMTKDWWLEKIYKDNLSKQVGKMKEPRPAGSGRSGGGTTESTSTNLKVLNFIKNAAYGERESIFQHSDFTPVGDRIYYKGQVWKNKHNKPIKITDSPKAIEEALNFTLNPVTTIIRETTKKLK